MAIIDPNAVPRRTLGYFEDIALPPLYGKYSGCKRKGSLVQTLPLPRYRTNVKTLTTCGLKRVNIKDDMINDEFNILCVGELPDDDMDRCFNILKGVDAILIPITHASYTRHELDTSHWMNSGLWTGQKHMESRMCVIANNPSYSDLQKISVMLLSDEDVPCYLMSKDRKKIRLSGQLAHINYDIKISDDMKESWEIQLLFRSVI